MREEIQRRLTNVILTKNDTLLHVSVRLGKTKIALDAIQPGDRVLWVYPLNPMRLGYLDDIAKFNPASIDITFCNISSIKKHKDTHWDFLVIDEPQVCQSAAQIKVLKTITYKRRVGLSGTMNAKTLKNLKEELNWTIGATYGLEDAIRDGIVKDYKVFIEFTKLDNSICDVEYKSYGRTKTGTEQQAYEAINTNIEFFEKKIAEAELAEDKKAKFFADLGMKKYLGLRTNLLYNSRSLFAAAERIIDRFKGEKALIYALRTDVADRLATITYHSKNKDDEALTWFKDSYSGHMAVVDCVTTGITIRNLNKIIFHSYDSNTETFHQKLARSLLHEVEGMESSVYACALRGTQNEYWIDRACSSLDPYKIFYIVDGEVDTKIGWVKKMNPDKTMYLTKTNGIVYANGFANDFTPMFSFVSSALNPIYLTDEEKLLVKRYPFGPHNLRRI